MEAVLAGQKLQRCRTAFLDGIRNCKRVLLCGEGNGRFLTAYRRFVPEATVVCLVSSRRMLDRAAASLRTCELRQAEFLCADILEWSPRPETFDAIVTNFFLDCFEPADLERVVNKLGKAASPEARWLISDFRVPPSGWRRVRALCIHRLMYTFFRVATGISAKQIVLPDHFLKQAGFRREAQKVADWGLLIAELWQRGP